MRTLGLIFFLTIAVAFAAAFAPGMVELSEGAVSEFYTDDYRGVIVTDERGFDGQGTFNTFETPDYTGRLDYLRSLDGLHLCPTADRPAVNPVLKLDRQIYPVRQRHPRKYETNPLP